MSITGLILKKIIDQNIADPKIYSKITTIDSVINVQAGRMKVTLILKNGEVEIKMGHHPSPTASVAGTMDAIMEVGQRKFHRVPAKFLSGKFKVGGNLFALMPLLSILKM